MGTEGGSREGHKDVTSYRCFVAETVARMNRRVATKVAEERAALKPLPVRRTSEYEEIDALPSANAGLRHWQ